MNEDVARIPLRRYDGVIVGYTTVDAADAELANQSTWRRKPSGDTAYARRSEVIDGVYTTIFLHREIMGLPRLGRDPQVDHIDGNGLRNTRDNLRILPPPHNAQNRRPRRDGSSGYRGVAWNQFTGKWLARARVGGRDYFLGRFSTAEEANDVVVAWRREHMPFSIEPDQS